LTKLDIKTVTNNLGYFVAIKKYYSWVLDTFKVYYYIVFTQQFVQLTVLPTNRKINYFYINNIIKHTYLGYTFYIIGFKFNTQ